ncbi:nSTAND1 domain-containing NTPase [Kibdelosporangium aridum]|uniref:WD40 repeat n=1 Tax=Kibdelosporangium aridum TaxID=2030 RepID=A0A1W1ZYI5_KIBAR|nr:BTAD domain-containing putative transcriptional regulator [Kibdelosporangium aridum]SMC53515.1 WD40 repeat [Kibdelosporangium aridum]
MGFQLLGPVELWVGDHRVDVGSAKQRSVLAVLLLAAGRPCSVESLIDRVWGEEPPAQVRGALYSYISRLRRVLRDTGYELRQHNGGYLLDIPVELVDVHRFDAAVREARSIQDLPVRVNQLREALDCWRGTPLQGISGRWADEVRESLSRKRVSVCTDWATRMIDLGRYDEVSDLLERELAEYPHAEAVACRLMTALQRQGRQAEALACYAALRERLIDDLGTEPGPELQQLHLRLLRGEDPPVVRPRPTEPPYLGLATFQPDDTARFFGRAELVAELRSRLTEHRFFAVFGPSGSGKSSLLRAGLMAAMRAEGWECVLLSPGRPFEVPDGRVLLIVDQFEEIFTLCGEEQRNEFVDDLLSLVDAKVVIGVRADFYAACAGLPALVAAMRDQQVLVGPMAESDLRAVVTEPAERADLTVEPALVDMVVAEVLGEPAALPLVSHALLETWRLRDSDRLTVSAYQQTGGVRGAIAQTADRLYASLDTDERRITRDILLRLTAPGDGPEDTRRRVHRAELGQSGAVLGKLAEARLVTLDEDTVTIVHESLVRGWPTLRQWINEDRDRLREHRRLTEAATDWDHHARDDSLLYRGARLASWEERGTDHLNDLERVFLAEAVRLRDRERRARRRRVHFALTGLSVALAVMMVLALIALAQNEVAQRQRDRALSGQLAARARSELPRDPELALLLAKRAVEIDSTESAQAALAQALVESRVRIRFTGHAGAVTGVDISPDNQSVATSGVDRTVRIWPVRGGTPPLVLASTDTALSDLAYNRHGDEVAAAGGGAVFVWKPSAGLQYHRYSAGPVALSAVAWSPDGREIAAAGADGQIRVWEIGGSSGVPQVLAGQHDSATAVAWSADGRWLASAGKDGRLLIRDLRTGAINTKDSGVAITDIDFTRDGKHIVAGGEDARTRIWPVAGDGKADELWDHRDVVHTVAYSHSGKFVITGGRDRTAHIVPADGRGDRVVLRGTGGPIRGVAFSPDDRLVATVSDDGTVRLWDPSVKPGIDVQGRHNGQTADVTMPTGSENAVSVGEDGTVRFGPKVTQGGNGPLRAVASAPNGEHILAVGDGPGVLVWHPGTDVVRRIDTGHTGPMTSVAADHLGLEVASGGNDGRIEISSFGKGTTRAVLAPSSSPVNDIEYSGDGRWMATAHADGMLRLWSLPNLSVHHEWRGPDGMESLAFSPDSQFVAGVGNDGAIRVWRTSGDGDPVLLNGHYGRVNGVSFSADGQYIVTAGNDQKVRVWKWAVRTDPIVFERHVPATTTSVDFGRGNRLAVGRGDGAVDVWTCEVCVPVEQLLAMAGQRLTRDFTTEERGIYLEDSP